jgi:hypothetical protein
MRFPEYEKWLLEQASCIPLEEGCTSIGPFATPTLVNQAPWEMDWTVLFTDSHYLRVKEHWYRRGVHLGGVGYRRTFSFHYGPTNPDRDEDGIPLPSGEYPAIIRIDEDDDWRGPHMHFCGENHIPQTRVKGLPITRLDPFEFIRAVIKQRRTNAGFDNILGFKVTK